MLRFVLAVSVAFVGQAGAQDINEIVSLARQNWQGINSLGIKVRLQNEVNEKKPSDDAILSIEYDFLIKGPQFLAKQRNTNAAGKNVLAFSLARNSKVNQMFDEQALYLQRQEAEFNANAPYGGPMAFVEPCDFLRPRSQPLPTLEEVGQDAYWADFAAHGRIIGKDSLDGRSTTVVEYSSDKTMYVGRPYRALVQFSEKENFYPIKYTLLVDSNEGTWTLKDYEVKQLKRVDGAGGEAYFVPIESVFVVQGEAALPPKKTTVTMDVESIRINHDIEDALFTIPEVQARIFSDNDDPTKSWDMTTAEHDVARMLADQPNNANASVDTQDSQKSTALEESLAVPGVPVEDAAKKWALYALLPIPLLLLVAFGLRHRSAKKAKSS